LEHCWAESCFSFFSCPSRERKDSHSLFNFILRFFTLKGSRCFLSTLHGPLFILYNCRSTQVFWSRGFTLDLELAPFNAESCRTSDSFHWNNLSFLLRITFPPHTQCCLEEMPPAISPREIGELTTNLLACACTLAKMKKRRVEPTFLPPFELMRAPMTHFLPPHQTAAQSVRTPIAILVSPASLFRSEAPPEIPLYLCVHRVHAPDVASRFNDHSPSYHCPPHSMSLII